MHDSSNVIGYFVLKGKIAAMVELAPMRGPVDTLEELASQLAQHIATMEPRTQVDLLSQPFVHNVAISVEIALSRGGARLVRWVRWHAGELDGPDRAPAFASPAA